MSIKYEGEDNKSQTPSAGADTIAKQEKKVKWTEENETILVEWCDIAQCYKWLYTRSHNIFASMHAWFTIPTIIFSTISGTASFAQASIPQEYQNYATLGIGTINIFIGIFATIQQYLKISELNESHRVSAISWDKFARNIRIELAKSPDERSDAGSFIKICRQEFDRLMETSPRIPEKIITEFIDKFRGKTEEEKDKYKSLKKPDICDTITTVNETRHKWYLEERKRNEEQKMEDEMERKYSFDSISDNNDTKSGFSSVMLTRLKDIRRRKAEGASNENLFSSQRELNINTEQDMEKEVQREVEKKKQEHIGKIKQYIERFNNLYERSPQFDEIYEALKDEVDKDILTNFYNSTK